MGNGWRVGELVGGICCDSDIFLVTQYSCAVPVSCGCDMKSGNAVVLEKSQEVGDRGAWP